MHLRRRGGQFSAGIKTWDMKGSRRQEAERNLSGAAGGRIVLSAQGMPRPKRDRRAEPLPQTAAKGGPGTLRGARIDPPDQWRRNAIGGAGAYVTAAALPLAAPRARTRMAPGLLGIAAGGLLLALLAVAGTLLLVNHPAMAQGHEVYFDGRMLCVAQSADAAVQALQAVQDELKRSFGMDVIVSQELTCRPVTCESAYILGPEGVKAALQGHVEARVMAAVITVNDYPAVALHTEEEARQALDAVLLPFRDAADNAGRTDFTFVENVQICRMPMDFSLVLSAEEAVRTLTMGSGVEDNPYTVEKGDSLARIAKAFGIKVSDLYKANPCLALNDVIQPGQSLNAVKPNNWVNVRYTETVTREEALPFESEVQTTDTLYTTQKQVQQEGKKGRREVVAKVTYINGMEAGKEILSQTVLEEATKEIVLKGTKKVPSTSTTNTAGKFMLPLKEYRITSKYGMRTLLGTTRMHYGVDLAAPTGTPIYASRSGTVSFSGSSSGYGLLVKINHGNGVETRYGHCSKLLVKKGQKVEKGQIIALVGSTGRSTGPHCHFEVRINGTPADPMK